VIVDIVFAAFPGPSNECVFVEVETLDGRSVRLGEWIERPDGLAALRVEVNDAAVNREDCTP
jgi:hypothetical protein